MKEIVLDVVARKTVTKHERKSLRDSGKIPAVFYGHSDQPVSLAVDMMTFEKMVKSGIGGNRIITLKWEGNTKSVLIKEIQNDVISRHPIHIDFHAINLKEKVEVSVPLHIVGEAPGVKLGGGVLEHILREVRVRCLPTDIPEIINVDISKLETGQSITVDSLPKPEGVEVLNDPHAIIVNVVAPTELEEAPAAAEAVVAGAAGAEPEVISKGKKEEGAEGAAGKTAAKPEAKGGEKK